LVVGLVAILVPVRAMAVEFAHQEFVTIAETETIAGSYFVAGKVVVINGDILGDLYCSGQDVTVNGFVEGDVNCFGQSVEVNGKVDGDVRVLAQSIKIAATIDRNLVTVGQSIDVDDDATIGREYLFAGQQVSSDADTARDVSGVGQIVKLNGYVGGDVLLEVESLQVMNNSIISGDLNYTSPNEAEVLDSSVGGDINYTFRQSYTEEASAGQNVGVGAYLVYVVFWMIASILLGVAVFWSLPRFGREVVQKMEEMPLQGIGLGFLGLLGGLIVPIVLLFSIFGVKLAFVAGFLWLVDVIVAPIFAGVLLGKIVVEKVIDKEKFYKFRYYLLIGIPLAELLYNAPGIGFFLGLIGLTWGLGGIYLAFIEKRKTVL
jgi:cytoskeletal protein CcmA (bactofilin family)